MQVALLLPSIQGPLSYPPNSLPPVPLHTASSFTGVLAVVMQEIYFAYVSEEAKFLSL